MRMYSGGNGSSVAEAIVIASSSSQDGIDAEYRLIEKLLGIEGKDWTLSFQELYFGDDKKPYDKLTIRLKDSTVREFFFDISSFYGKLR